MGTGVCFKSQLEILELGRLLSKELFGGLNFGGLDEYIHEEIPAIYIKSPILGFQVILDGDQDEHYCLDIGLHPICPSMSVEGIQNYAFFRNGFDEHLKFLLKQIPEIDVMEE
ncbi:hypothetical protein [Gottfriedia solisilvae]|uniref:hypothetical protein n=1 Tax=Gottfriedia solisilvae TaxID=1516104 RepID=UPI003D2F4D6C